MIIRKPYAFLIKNFRIIHGILFAMLLFLMFKTINIYSFFNQYVLQQAYQLQSNLSSLYVTPFMFVLSVLIIVVSLIIFYILSIKGKGNKFYLIVFIYYALYFIFLIYMTSVFNNLELGRILTIESRRAVRDISIIVLLPQIVFSLIMVARTLGFNLKQFEFKKDLEELDIDVSDSEEVELTLGSDTYKIARFFRKLLRLTKYFILENKIFVIGCACIIVTIISFFIYSKIDVYAENYSENQELIARALSFNVEESFITTTAVNNTIIDSSKKYVLVKLNITNRQNKSYSLNNETFGLLIDNKIINPTQGLSEKFFDIGTTFVPMDIVAGSEKTVVIVFEIDKKNEQKEFIFKIKNESMNVKDEYKDIIIKPKNLDEDNKNFNFTLDSQIDFSDSLLKDSNLYIGSVEINNSFKEKYTYTINGKDNEGYYYVAPPSNMKGTMTILRIESTLTMTKEDIYMKKKLKTSADLFNYYGIIRYRYLGEYKNVKLQKLDVDVNKNLYAYMLIPIEVKKANKIDLFIVIRGVKYTINLK
ncbi:MAG: DUF4352 domain-containing protein [Bacilli bacterium]|nr:DUF4352 domain-containing protein [Bacilli bacterium]